MSNEVDPVIEFVDYSGSWPSLCSGVLTIRVNGKEYELRSILSSGGSVSFDDNWSEEITDGPWQLWEGGLPEEIRKYAPEIEDLVNSNIPWGCCGGCV